MSMTPDQDNFEELRKILAIKRHEQPPPGYFHDFSRQVVSRIRAGETADDGFMARLSSRIPWLGSLWEGFEAKPLVAGAFGVGVCSLLVVGLVSSERIDANAISITPVGDNSQKTFAIEPIGSLFERTASQHMATDAVYTAQSRSSIFDEIKPHVQNVNFSVPARSN